MSAQLRPFTNEKTIDLVQKSLENEKEIHNGNGKKESNGSKFKRSIARFLVDFDVVSYTIAFLVAISLQEFLKELITTSLMKITKRSSKNNLLILFLTIIIILIISYIFVEFIFYKFIYTDDVEKESILRSAITSKKHDEVKKEIEKEPEIKKEIKKTTKIASPIDDDNDNENESENNDKIEPYYNDNLYSQYSTFSNDYYTPDM